MAASIEDRLPENELIAQISLVVSNLCKVFWTE